MRIKNVKIKSGEVEIFEGISNYELREIYYEVSQLAKSFKRNAKTTNERISNNVWSKVKLQLKPSVLNPKKRYYFNYKDNTTYYTIDNEFCSNTEMLVYIKDRLTRKIRDKRKVEKYIEPLRCQFKGQPYDKIGLVHNKPNTFLNMLVAIQRVKCFEDKRPNAYDNYVGIEIEFISKTSQEQLAEMFYNAKLSNYITIKSDGSLRNIENYPYPHEVVFLAPENEIKSITTKVCDIIKQAQSVITTKCGLHVHLDLRNRNKEKVFRNLVRCQNLFFKLVKSERRTNGYCKKTESENWDNYLGSSERYYCVNGPASYERHKTCEIRLYHGTLDAFEIIQWANLLVKIVNYNEIVPTLIDKLEVFDKYFKLEKESREYFKEKMVEYA